MQNLVSDHWGKKNVYSCRVIRCVGMRVDDTSEDDGCEFNNTDHIHQFVCAWSIYF